MTAPRLAHRSGAARRWGGERHLDPDETTAYSLPLWGIQLSSVSSFSRLRSRADASQRRDTRGCSQMIGMPGVSLKRAVSCCSTWSACSGRPDTGLELPRARLTGHGGWRVVESELTSGWGQRGVEWKLGWMTSRRLGEWRGWQHHVWSAVGSSNISFPITSFRG